MQLFELTLVMDLQNIIHFLFFLLTFHQFVSLSSLNSFLLTLPDYRDSRELSKWCSFIPQEFSFFSSLLLGQFFLKKLKCVQIFIVTSACFRINNLNIFIKPWNSPIWNPFLSLINFIIFYYFWADWCGLVQWKLWHRSRDIWRSSHISLRVHSFTCDRIVIF